MAFEGLSARLQEITRKLGGKARITEGDLKEVLREVKLALLEADVNYKIVKDFIKVIEEKALGQDVLKSLTPGQQVVKIVKDELVELLYMAYNRDEAEVFGLDKAVKAGYDELYSTAPDIIEKQMQAIDKEIEEEALEKAKQKVTEVRNERQKALQEKREKKVDLIDEVAQLLLEENSNVIGKGVAKEAIEKIEEDKKKRKGGTKEDGKEQKPKRTRKTKTA